ncbi:hypothetical protein ACH5RR_029508 [Cinchona calisaya]|uniref:Uncharacterized protein n=1 Tax=Cinchona calisaya TaxID=153742 RepID=A0ABD2YWA7_9GENT
MTRAGMINIVTLGIYNKKEIYPFHSSLEKKFHLVYEPYDFQALIVECTNCSGKHWAYECPRANELIIQSPSLSFQGQEQYSDLDESQGVMTNNTAEVAAEEEIEEEEGEQHGLEMTLKISLLREFGELVYRRVALKFKNMEMQPCRLQKKEIGTSSESTENPTENKAPTPYLPRLMIRDNTFGGNPAQQSQRWKRSPVEELAKQTKKIEQAKNYILQKYEKIMGALERMTDKLNYAKEELDSMDNKLDMLERNLKK